MRAKRILFILAAIGCGAAGALTLANTLFLQTQSVFGVQWSAYMIFMVLVGGIGTVEGPIIGAIVFYLIQNRFADYGAWYLVGLGTVAIVFALFLPRGLWGTVESRFSVRLLPVGYVLRKVEPGVSNPRGRVRARLRHAARHTDVLSGRPVVRLRSHLPIGARSARSPAVDQCVRSVADHTRLGAWLPVRHRGAGAGCDAHGGPVR